MSRRFTLEQKAAIVRRYMEEKEENPKLWVEDYLARAGICKTAFHRWKRDPEVLSIINGGNAFVKVAGKPKAASGKTRMSTGFRLVRRGVTVEFDAGADIGDVRAMLGILEG
ncbi:MAG: hypothetical protein LKK25_07715 [Sphaerochaeta sp.]|nr:hypothetical protein [Sphaerochaeta sp.]